MYEASGLLNVLNWVFLTAYKLDRLRVASNHRPVIQSKALAIDRYSVVRTGLYGWAMKNV
jgi:hypothetical protein